MVLTQNPPKWMYPLLPWHARFDISLYLRIVSALFGSYVNRALMCVYVHAGMRLVSQAIERLHVNKMLTTTCLQLLETSTSAFKQHVDRRVMHTMLIANNKLLSLHSLYERVEYESVWSVALTWASMGAFDFFPHHAFQWGYWFYICVSGRPGVQLSMRRWVSDANCLLFTQGRCEAQFENIVVVVTRYWLALQQFCYYVTRSA